MSRDNRRKRGKPEIIGSAGRAGADFSWIGLSHFLPVTRAAIFMSGALMMVVFALNTSLVQSHVADAMRGRVMSVYNVAFRGGMPFGGLICGFLWNDLRSPRCWQATGFWSCCWPCIFLLIQKKLTKL